jgi:hypothetical protein
VLNVAHSSSSFAIYAKMYRDFLKNIWKKNCHVVLEFNELKKDEEAVCALIGGLPYILTVREMLPS